MGSKIEYVDSSQIYATTYVRNSKAVGVLWAIFTLCYGIMVIVASITPDWIGFSDTDTNGKFGLWSFCSSESERWCQNGNNLEKFMSIQNVYTQIAIILIAVSVLTAVLAILTFTLCLFCRSTVVFYICGWMQLFSAFSMIGGCICFPAGWNDEEVNKLCQNSGAFDIGRCEFRWAYVLAGVSGLDAVILSILAFILASRHISLQADPHYAPASIYKGDVNGAFLGDNASVAGSRKSLNLHPVLLMHPGQDDTYSQFSQRTVPRSIRSGHYSYPHFQHNL